MRIFHLNSGEDVYDVLLSHQLSQLCLFAPAIFLPILQNYRIVKAEYYTSLIMTTPRWCIGHWGIAPHILNFDTEGRWMLELNALRHFRSLRRNPLHPVVRMGRILGEPGFWPILCSWKMPLDSARNGTQISWSSSLMTSRCSAEVSNICWKDIFPCYLGYRGLTTVFFPP
jgi:hypothetical protein